MKDIYQMSHNACCVNINRGARKVFVRLFLLKGDQSPKWYFNVTSADGEHCFTSSTFTSSTLALNGVIEFVEVVGGCFLIPYLLITPFGYLSELFSDVIYR